MCIYCGELNGASLSDDEYDSDYEEAFDMDTFLDMCVANDSSEGRGNGGKNELYEVWGAVPDAATQQKGVGEEEYTAARFAEEWDLYKERHIKIQQVKRWASEFFGVSDSMRGRVLSVSCAAGETRVKLADDTDPLELCLAKEIEDVVEADLWKAFHSLGVDDVDGANLAESTRLLREYKARNTAERNPSRFYAVKVIKKSNDEEKRPMITSISTLREAKLLRELSHPHVVNMTDVLIDAAKGQLAMVFEYAEWDMRKIIADHRRRRERIPSFTIKSMVWQALDGLRYLHENWVIHRDLKPQNILIIGDGSKRGSVQISDFGLARIYRNPVKPLAQVDRTVVTLWYRAPELLLGARDYGASVDVWSLGCIFADLCTADNPHVRALFPGKENKSSTHRFEADQCDQIFRVLGLPSPVTWPEVESCAFYSKIKPWRSERGYPTHSVLKNKAIFPSLQGKQGGGAKKSSTTTGSQSPVAYSLLSAMLELNPNLRITASDARRHEYFKREKPVSHYQHARAHASFLALQLPRSQPRPP